MNLQILPNEIISKIFLYLQCPTAKMIRNEINIYEKDHNWDLTKMYRLYYVKNILDFSVYYFDKLYDPFDYASYNSSLSYGCDDN